MKNALMITTETRGMGESLKAIDRVKWTTGMPKVHDIDPRITADEIIDYIREKMTLQPRKEAQHEDRGGQRNGAKRDVRQTDADVAQRNASAKQDTPKGSGGASDASGGKPKGPYHEVGVQVVDAILAEVYRVQSVSHRSAAQKAERATPLGHAGAIVPRVPGATRRTRRQRWNLQLLRAQS